MKKEYRIKRSGEIDAVFKNKNARGDKYFVIYQKKSNEQHFRFSISIGKKYGNAVKRNKCKRQIRSIIREVKNKLSHDLFVIVVKPTARTLTYQEIRLSIQSTLIKSKLMNGEKDE